MHHSEVIIHVITGRGDEKQISEPGRNNQITMAPENTRKAMCSYWRFLEVLLIVRVHPKVGASIYVKVLLG